MRAVPRLRALLVGLFAALTVVAFVAPAAAKGNLSLGEPQRLEVPGQPDAFYYRPKARGLQPVIMFLHGRGGNPAEDCRKWARVGTQLGWVVCPQGPEDRGNGARAWNNSVPAGKAITESAITALRAKFKGRVQSRNNILIGFSEGAFIAMQLGVHDPARWSRWLILAANDQYWWGDATDVLKENRRLIKRVYLLTGENDMVAENTRRVADLVRAARVTHRVRIAPGLGHEVPEDRMVKTYRRPLLWLAAAK